MDNFDLVLNIASQRHSFSFFWKHTLKPLGYIKFGSKKACFLTAKVETNINIQNHIKDLIAFIFKVSLCKIYKVPNIVVYKNGLN
jgi:hypothetical protein